MCMICRNIICPSSCPNCEDSGALRELRSRDAETEPVSECSACGKELYPGDTALLLEDIVLCEACAAEATVRLSSERDAFKE